MKKLITLVLVFLMTVSALAFTLMGVSAKVI